MARISYTSYRFQAPPLMEKEFFDHLKALPVKEGCIRFRPYDGFVKTFPGWCIFFGLLLLVCVFMFFKGEKEFLVPLIAWPALALWTGGLHSMGSWLGYYMDCSSYYDVYSRHINEAKSYPELKRLRQGLHVQAVDPLHGLFPGMNHPDHTNGRNRGSPRPPRGPWTPL
jgi:hypothetical protein